MKSNVMEGKINKGQDYERKMGEEVIKLRVVKKNK
jgi:hypothetical protein